ncbi:MAG: response regulator [Deltaproteobacteria bacterium]|nr:response regulator [Deltaproteobacteria bacterium]
MALKVLTVDDSKTIRMIVKKAFKSFECELFEAENGRQGLEVAKKERPGLIVLDITMPVMTGTEMLAKLKNDPDLKDTPVIMLTAESGKENVLEIVKMGVSDYVVKPFKGEQLIERVTKILTLEPKKGAEPEDTSKKFFSVDGDVQILTLPQKIDRPTSVEIEGHLKGKIEAMLGSGLKKMILDMQKVVGTNVILIKLIIAIIQNCQNANIRVRVVGTRALHDELKEFQETSEIPIDLSIEEAKEKFQTG